MGKTKIYKEYDGKIYEAEARETKKMYIVDSYVDSAYWAFGYRKNFCKDEVHLTAIDALDDAITRTHNNLERCKRETNVVISNLMQLKKLKNKLDTTPRKG